MGLPILWVKIIIFDGRNAGQEWEMDHTSQAGAIESVYQQQISIKAGMENSPQAAKKKSSD